MFYGRSHLHKHLHSFEKHRPDPVGLVPVGERSFLEYSERPNIKSWLTAANGYFFAGNATGAFSSAGYMSKKTANNYAENSSVDSGYGGLNLNAETFNPLYGNSSTVQPAGLYGLYLVRAYQA